MVIKKNLMGKRKNILGAETGWKVKRNLIAGKRNLIAGFW